MTSARIEILKKSLEKKTAKINDQFDNHFATVKQANGQPLNDKRNGAATLKKWESRKTQSATRKQKLRKQNALLSVKKI